MLHRQDKKSKAKLTLEFYEALNLANTLGMNLDNNCRYVAKDSRAVSSISHYVTFGRAGLIRRLAWRLGRFVRCCKLMIVSKERSLSLYVGARSYHPYDSIQTSVSVIMYQCHEVFSSPRKADLEGSPQQWEILSYDYLRLILSNATSLTFIQLSK